MKKKIFLNLLILSLLFAVAGYVAAASGDNVSGYAWSENIGWINFSGDNYGVNIEGNGDLSGYAWSENIGWIRFDPEEPYPASPFYSACIDLPGEGESCNGVGEYQVSGWARACSVFETGCSGTLAGNDKRGGWDGWIKLKGSNYGVWADTSLTRVQLRGWAFGGDDTSGAEVVGWISFNRLNCDSDGDGYSDGSSSCPPEGTVIPEYKVEANFSPIANISCDPSSCTGYIGSPLILKNESTDPNGEDDIKSSIWSKEETDGSYSEIFDCDNKCDLTLGNPSFLSAGSYTVSLYIEDSKEQSDDAEIGIELKNDIIADFECSLDGDSWKECEDIEVEMGNVIYLKDLSVPSDGASINSWDWEKDGVDFSNDSAPTTTATERTMEIKLTVGDTAGRTDSAIHTVNAGQKVPGWQEITPTGFFRYFLAGLLGVLMK